MTSTITECANGTIESVTGGGSPAWQVLANTGAAPLPHPPWSPDNHDYINFADGPSVVVGRIL